MKKIIIALILCPLISYGQSKLIVKNKKGSCDTVYGNFELPIPKIDTIKGLLIGYTDEGKQLTKFGYVIEKHPPSNIVYGLHYPSITRTYYDSLFNKIEHSLYIFIPEYNLIKTSK